MQNIKYRKYISVNIDTLVDIAIDHNPTEAEDIIHFLQWFISKLTNALKNNNSTNINRIHLYTYKMVCKKLGYLKVFYPDYGIEHKYDLRFDGFNQDLTLYNKALRRLFKKITDHHKLTKNG